MKRSVSLRRWAGALATACCIATGSSAQAPEPPGTQELMAALSAARSRGCAPQARSEPHLRWVAPLAEAARRMAQGSPAAEALKSAGYRARKVFRVQLGGYDSVAAVARAMTQKYCEPLTNPQLTDVGFHRQGGSYWILLAEPFNPPAPAAAADVAARVLALTNQARSQPRRCGNESFDAAAPLRSNAQLDQAAAAHAEDMARLGLLQHEGRDGSSAAQRVSRAGYRWGSVGENIASGQSSADQVVAEWTRSPDHCANLMNPRFTDMGVAYAVNMNSEGGIYWAQEFGRPRR
jgi:uncharacterized protein YkwD